MTFMPMPAPKRRGMFGIPMASGTPRGPFDFPTEDVAGPTVAATAGQDPSQTPPAYQKPSTLQNIAGSVGDALLNWSGGQAIYGPQMAAQRQAAMAEAARQRQRGEEYADWQKKQEYTRANPMPSTAQPYRWESNDGDVYQLGSDGQPARVFDDPTPKMNFIPDGLGGGQWVAVPTSAPQQPSAPVGALKPVGKLTPIGGATPSASGGFP